MLLGLGALWLMVAQAPKHWAEVRRAWAMVAVEARVLGHRSEKVISRGRYGGTSPIMKYDIQIEYAAGGATHRVWVPFATEGMQPNSVPAPPRPGAGETVRVWYHPDAPGEPTRTDPRRWGAVFGLLFMPVWLGLIVLMGIGCALLAVQRLRRWARGEPSPDATNLPYRWP